MKPEYKYGGLHRKAEHLSQIQAAVAAVKERKTIRRFYFVACGGSQASMMPIQYMFDRETSIPSAIYTSNEFVKATPKVLDDTCVVLTISHSGNTPETVRAAELAKEKGAVSISLTNLVDSPLWKACEYPIHYEHGPEADPNDLSKVILYTLAFDMLNVVEPSDKRIPFRQQTVITMAVFRQLAANWFFHRNCGLLRHRICIRWFCPCTIPRQAPTWEAFPSSLDFVRSSLQNQK